MANNKANPQISLCSREFSLVLIFTPSKLVGFNQTFRRNLSGASGRDKRTSNYRLFRGSNYRLFRGKFCCKPTMVEWQLRWRGTQAKLHAITSRQSKTVIATDAFMHLLQRMLWSG